MYKKYGQHMHVRLADGRSPHCSRSCGKLLSGRGIHCAVSQDITKLDMALDILLLLADICDSRVDALDTQCTMAKRNCNHIATV
eukprot:scaffold666261_cov27-Prasinocladus_malaysianus.AAC.1